jgi:hypothetical protein
MVALADNELAVSSNDAIERLGRIMLTLPDLIPDKVSHHFAPGVYVRAGYYPAGAIVVGFAHKHETMNILLKGKIRVVVDGVTCELAAPCIINSAAGSRKVAYIVEDVIWLNVHPNPTDETDENKLCELFITKRSALTEHELAAIGEGA